MLLIRYCLGFKFLGLSIYIVLVENNDRGMARIKQAVPLPQRCGILSKVGMDFCSMLPRPRDPVRKGQRNSVTRKYPRLLGSYRISTNGYVITSNKSTKHVINL